MKRGGATVGRRFRNDGGRVMAESLANGVKADVDGVVDALRQDLRERIREVNNAAAVAPAERVLALINSQPRTPTR